MIKIINYFKTYMNDPERRKKEVIPGIFDSVFKGVFTSVNGLIEEVISSIDNFITKEDMKDMKIVNSELIKETVLEKGRITDLIVEVRDKVIDLEMNAVFYEKLLKRNNEYIGKVQSLYEGKYTYQINIDNFSLFDNESSIIKFQMMSDKGHIDKTFIVKYHVNLEVIKNKYYNKEELTRLEKIMLMLKLTDREELKKLSKGDTLMERIYKELDKMSKDKESLLSYSKYELEMEGWKEQIKKEVYEEAYDKYHGEGLEKGLEEGRKEGRKEGIKEGRKEGIKQGIEQGIEQGILQTAKNLLSMKFKIEDIAKATGLPIEEIEKIKESL